MAKIGEGLQKAAQDRTPEQDTELVRLAAKRIEDSAAFHRSFREARQPTLHVYGATIVRY
tara:strand:- start:927 stop:1106 length:180 start_codon:yes stop_codon:yes gene_type:complete